MPTRSRAGRKPWRALAILPAQVLYDDLHEIEVHNSRLERANGLADALLTHLAPEAGRALAGWLAPRRA